MPPDINLVDLPIDILEEIFCRLDSLSFGHLMLTCKHFLGICANENYWEQRCSDEYSLKSMAGAPSWRQLYGLYHLKFGQFGAYVYKRIRAAWFKIEHFFEANGSRISFDDPATPQDIENLKQEFGNEVQLPNDYLCSLMIHNGQKIDESVLNGLSSGAFGSLYAYEDYKTEFLASTMNVLIAQNHANADRRQAELSFVCLTIAVTNRHWANSQLLCITPNDVDLPDRKIQHGYVISAPQLRHRFDLPSWIMARNYTEWLENFASSLENNRFALSLNEPVTDNNELLRFYWDPDCEARTGPFVCRVATAFIPEHSIITPPRFYYSYRVTLMMDKDANPVHSCKLESRHWVITDGEGRTERVDGPGVIGQFPKLEPGSSFSYVSCTFYPTLTGRMTGHFRMKYLSPHASNGYVDIVVPLFTLRAPEWVFLKPVAMPENMQSSDSFDQDTMPT